MGIGFAEGVSTSSCLKKRYVTNFRSACLCRTWSRYGISFTSLRFDGPSQIFK
jgi:hypothetical protein